MPGWRAEDLQSYLLFAQTVTASFPVLVNDNVLTICVCDYHSGIPRAPPPLHGYMATDHSVRVRLPVLQEYMRWGESVDLIETPLTAIITPCGTTRGRETTSDGCRLWVVGDGEGEWGMDLHVRLHQRREIAFGVAGHRSDL